MLTPSLKIGCTTFTKLVWKRNFAFASTRFYAVFSVAPLKNVRSSQSLQEK